MLTRTERGEREVSMPAWIGGLAILFVVGGLVGLVVGPLWRWLKSKDPARNPDTTERIRHLGALRDEGLLTDDEFQAKKQDLLDQM
jgi:hypothetical protein